MLIKVQLSITNGSIRRVTMFADTPEALELGRLLEVGKYGRGEAACMAYLTHNEGTLGRNNLSDVKEFCRDNNTSLLSTGDALYEAYDGGIISIEEADKIWSDMVEKKRKLPAASFTDYIACIRGE